MTNASSRLRMAGEILLVLGRLRRRVSASSSPPRRRSTPTRATGSARPATSRRFFVQRDFSPEAWADGYWTRTQPMVFRYVIGSWLWLRGHDLQIQNPNYDYSKTAAANRRLGLAPADDVAGRCPDAGPADGGAGRDDAVPRGAGAGRPSADRGGLAAATRRSAARTSRRT